ncbi:response regulator [Saccharothrix longispora]|uniref:response regulator n=1 Tax=Saccharothrix longispora TaxID=33920 RepID=UPI0028FD9720|nr:response regulator [Saccharothrix longispora]MDU0292743.1 response regulator [Saccharothrix longispora]
MAEMTNAIASLLWPVVVLVLLFWFRGQLRDVIGSAAKREVTLEIGGQTVSLGKLSEVQGDAIADLQQQLSALREQLDLGGVPAAATVEQPTGGTTSTAVLWVDDTPENNVLEIAQLSDNGVKVDLARSTDEGLALFGRGRYRAVVTDMGRVEAGSEVTDAGLRLIRALRELDPTTPVAVYAGPHTVRTMGGLATEAGADTVTASPWELSEFFRKLRLR